MRLWQLRNDPDDFEQARLTMDRAASLVGEWLIVSDRLVTDTGTVTTGGWRFFRRLFGLRRLFGRRRRVTPAA
jgi:hypothetical protein